MRSIGKDWGSGKGGLKRSAEKAPYQKIRKIEFIGRV